MQSTSEVVNLRIIRLSGEFRDMAIRPCMSSIFDTSGWWGWSESSSDCNASVKHWSLDAATSRFYAISSLCTTVTNDLLVLTPCRECSGTLKSGTRVDFDQVLRSWSLEIVTPLMISLNGIIDGAVFGIEGWFLDRETSQCQWGRIVPERGGWRSDDEWLDVRLPSHPFGTVVLWVLFEASAISFTWAYVWIISIYRRTKSMNQIRATQSNNYSPTLYGTEQWRSQ